MEDNSDKPQEVSAFSGLGGARTGIFIYATITLVLGYAIWIGITGQPLPRWFLWAATIL